VPDDHVRLRGIPTGGELQRHQRGHLVGRAGDSSPSQDDSNGTHAWASIGGASRICLALPDAAATGQNLRQSAPRRLFALAAECDGHFPIGEHKYLDLMADRDRGSGLVAPTGELWRIWRSHPAKTAAWQRWSWPSTRCTDPTSDRPADRRGRRRRRRHRCSGGAGVGVPAEHGGRTRRRGSRSSESCDSYGSMCRPVTADPSRRLARGALRGPGVTTSAWLQVNNAAFRDHPENGSWTREILADRIVTAVVRSGGVRDGLGRRSAGRFLLDEAARRSGRDLRDRGVTGSSGLGLGRFLTVRGLEVIHDHWGFYDRDALHGCGQRQGGEPLPKARFPAPPRGPVAGSGHRRLMGSESPSAEAASASAAERVGDVRRLAAPGARQIVCREVDDGDTAAAGARRSGPCRGQVDVGSSRPEG
jgi:hypothetical protein